MSFLYGKASETWFEGVDPGLVSVARRALVISAASKIPIDWSIVDGVRTPERQAILFKQGHSRTLNSAHIPWADGLGHALDFKPWIGGADPFPRKGDPPAIVRLKLERFEQIAAYFFEAADELFYPLQWGNDWDLDGIPTGRDPNEKGFLQDMVHVQTAPAHRLTQAIAARERRIAARARGEAVIS